MLSTRVLRLFATYAIYAWSGGPGRGGLALGGREIGGIGFERRVLGGWRCGEPYHDEACRECSSHSIPPSAVMECEATEPWASRTRPPRRRPYANVLAPA